MLTQLVYTSRPRFDVSGPEGRKVLDDIAATARRKHAENGISGMLLVGEDWLSQILEGESAALGPMLKDILADQRHDSVQIVDMRMVPSRRFDGVSVGVSSRPISDIPIGRLADLSAEDFVALAGVLAR